jgi:hypothetical protein
MPWLHQFDFTGRITTTDTTDAKPLGRRVGAECAVIR